MIKSLDHINLTVKNLKESIEWYKNTFDFELKEEGIYNGAPWGIIKSGEAMLCIYEHPEFEALHEPRKHGTHGINHYSIRIQDKEAWLERIQEQNLKINYGGVVNWPHSESWYVNDPTGYEIEVVKWNEEKIQF